MGESNRYRVNSLAYFWCSYGTFRSYLHPVGFRQLTYWAIALAKPVSPTQGGPVNNDA
ncbi:MAG: hypothetical protein R3B93_00455 [Bacteroidia bacterium]